MNVADVLARAAQRLGNVDARVEARRLACHAWGVDAAWLIAHADAVLAPGQITAFEQLVARRKEGEPVAYLLGTRGFGALDLHVTPDVLIPRPETELLVELALQRIPADAGCTVADLGTGSGAIALAIAHARPRARVLATDASAAALAVARGNATRLRLDNVAFAQGDWCAALGNVEFDIIVSNPPYVAEGDPHLDAGDLRCEPRLALASGVDGLDALRVIVRCTREHLRAGGWLLLEHGWEQGGAVRDLLAASRYVDVFTARDLEARERVSGGTKS